MNITLLHPDIEAAYYDPAFLLLIESHLTYLRGATGLNLLEVTEMQGYKYEGDFFGLLDDLNVDKKYHHIVMRVNDMVSGADYKGNLPSIVLPSLSAIDSLKNIFQTSADNSD